jgi:hypothetical protein
MDRSKLIYIVGLPHGEELLVRALSGGRRPLKPWPPDPW